MPYEIDEIDEQLLAALRDGARTPAWLLDRLDLPMSTRSAVQQRLRLLDASGEVVSIGHGLYELPCGYVPADEAGGRERGDDQEDDAPERSGEPLPETTADESEAVTSHDGEDIRSVVETVDSIPQRFGGEDVVPVVQACIDRIRDGDSPTMRDLIADVMPAHSLGYDVPDDIYGESRPRPAWWRKIVRPALQRLDSVEQRGDGTWRYVGE